jgi:hypothetical protein
LPGEQLEEVEREIVETVRAADPKAEVTFTFHRNPMVCPLDEAVVTVLYGPRGEGAHAAEEWVDLPSVAACTRVLMDTARRFWQI